MRITVPYSGQYNVRDLTTFALFTYVAEHESFSAAARKLGMPKSTLSRRISDLEADLGVRLLHRTTRKVTLTDVGNAFLLHCQTLVSAAEAAEQVTQFVQEIPRGRVRISSPYALSQSLLVKILPDFMHQYPEVIVDLMVTNKAINLIDENMDIALRVRTQIADASLIARPLGSSLGALFAHPDLIVQRGEPKHPMDLISWPSLSMHYSSGRYQHTFSKSGEERISLTYQPKLITDDMWMLREAAEQKLGMVALPVYLCHASVAAGKLVKVLPDWQLPTGRMHLVYPHRRGLLPAVRVLIDFLMEHMPQVAGEAGMGEE